MNGYTHMVVGGLCAGLPVALSIAERKLGFSIYGHQVYPFVGVLPAIIGALGPDIDMPGSKGGKSLRAFLKAAISVSGIGVLLLSVYVCVGVKGERFLDILVPCAVFFGLSCCITMFITTAKHRRETHSGLVMLILLLPNVYMLRFTRASLFTGVLLSVWLGFCIGWLSHLAADTFNKKGVPWLYPFSKKYFHLAGFVTGTEGETIFRKFCIVLFVVVYAVLIISRAL
ncbi:MAG: metal-dependent hydrolase [Spirochaetaceae bacterium]|jgi:inner membrane protein|nr:metal-dependent hydrolase [Spirochaetaceae bacterium]